jgi:hypothetical protein
LGDGPLESAYPRYQLCAFGLGHDLFPLLTYRT